MSALGLRIIDESVQQANIWINDVNDRTGWGDKQRAYRLMRSVLHRLRDALTPDEVAHLAAQMPLFVRGLFYEGWTPSGTPVRYRARPDFIDAVQRDFGDDRLAEPEAEVGAVLDTLKSRISDGEMSDVRHRLSKDVQRLFL